MGKTKAKNRARVTHPTAPSAVNADKPLERVDAALVAGRYKDAVAAGKLLLKQASSDADEAMAKERLARAYAGRAGQLAAKSMFVEALAILEQRASACGAAPPAIEQMLWTLHAGRPERAAALLREHAQALDRSGELPALRERLAARLLSGDELLEWLDPDEPLRRDHPAAEALLQAFCASDDFAFDATAKRIPWRSPYRGFRQLLDAWRRHADEPEAAVEAFARLAPSSPFGALAGRLQGLLEPPGEALPEAVARLRALDPVDLDAAAAVLGWPATVLALLRAARTLGDAANEKSRLRLLLEHADAFDADEVRDAARALMLHAPQMTREVFSRFGKPSAFQAARLEALRSERDGDESIVVDDAWRDVLEALENSDESAESPPKFADRALTRALVHRRLAELWSLPPLVLHSSAVALEELGRSLELDPDDVPTTVRLISMHRDADDLKSAREVLDAAIERFPDEPRILLEAVRTALAGGAFKKASRLAERLLEIDPVNVPVKTLLLDAALAHARKQIRASRFDLARRQLDETAVQVGAGEPRARVEIVYGLLELASGERGAETVARSRLRAGFDALGGELAGLFAVALESVRLGRDAKMTLTRAKLPSARGFATKEAVRVLVRALSAVREEKSSLAAALVPLETTLGTVAKKRWSHAEYENICETLLRRELLHVLEPFAERASRRHTQVPAFVYLHEYAAVRGAFFALEEAAIVRLQAASRHAMLIEDMRTVHRIEEFLSPPMFGGFDDTGADWFDEPADDLFVGPSGKSSPFAGLPSPDELPPALLELLDLIGVEGMMEIERAVARGEEPDTVIERLLGELDIDPETRLGDLPKGSGRARERGGKRGRSGRR